MTYCTFCGEFLWDENKFVPGRMTVNIRRGVSITLCNECRKGLLAWRRKAHA